jgi:plasmid stabilization system protein ParE
MTGYDFHPEALDLDEIWEFIAEANLDAADRVIVDILAALDQLLPFPNQGHKRPDLTSRPGRQSRPCGGSSPSAINHLHLRETAIHKQFNSRDVTAVVGREKHHGLRDLIRCA